MSRLDPPEIRAIKAAQGAQLFTSCSAEVRLSQVDTVTKRGRIRDAAKAGHAPEICGRRTAWIVDRKPYCLNHAGQAALRILACVEVGGGA